MTATLGSLADDLIARLQGDPSLVPGIAALSGSIGTTDLSFTVDDAKAISRGIVEIGTELILVKVADRTTGSVTAYKRGYRGTAASTHAAGDLVTMSPPVPRSMAIKALQGEISALYPNLFGVATTQYASQPFTLTYPLPATATFILDVRWQDMLGNWQRTRNWQVERSLDSTSFPTGVGISVREWFRPGTKMQVIYGTQPVIPTNETDLFTSTGYADDIGDLVLLGATLRLLPNADIARLGYQTASGSEGNKQVQPGSATIITRELKAQYVARLQTEVLALKQLYPARAHITR